MNPGVTEEDRKWALWALSDEDLHHALEDMYDPLGGTQEAARVAEILASKAAVLRNSEALKALINEEIGYLKRSWDMPSARKRQPLIYKIWHVFFCTYTMWEMHYMSPGGMVVQKRVCRVCGKMEVREQIA